MIELNHKTLITQRKPIFEIPSYLEAIEKNTLLYAEKNFDQRLEVIDVIEFQIIDPIEEFLQKTGQEDLLISLKHRAEKIRAELQAIDSSLFQRLRAKIRTVGYTGIAFTNLIHEYVDFNLGAPGFRKQGYDNLDVFINGLSHSQMMPSQTKDLEPEMIGFQKTPVRIIFELVERFHFTKEDVFFDIGSGLGQVAMLVNLLAGITTTGIEFEPAFCAYARDCARELNLSGVSFINADARKADYSGGTVFFMFTPFAGEILQEVLVLLRKESLQRKIKIITHGPCTVHVASQSWLEFASKDDIYNLGVFTSS